MSSQSLLPTRGKEEIKEEIEEELLKMNNDIGMNIPKNMTEKAKEKCMKTGMWLFSNSKDEICDRLSR